MDGMTPEDSMADTYPNIDSQNNVAVCLQPELTQQWQLEKQLLQMWSDSKTGLNSDMQLRTTNTFLQSKLESSEVTNKYQQDLILQQSLTIKRLEEKVANLVHINNMYHIEKQIQMNLVFRHSVNPSPYCILYCVQSAVVPTCLGSAHKYTFEITVSPY